MQPVLPPEVALFAMRRAAFIERLRANLAARGVSLVTAELAHNGINSVWLLSFVLPNQHVASAHAPILPPADPLHLQVADDVAGRLAQSFLMPVG